MRLSIRVALQLSKSSLQTVIVLSRIRSRVKGYKLPKLLLTQCKMLSMLKKSKHRSQLSALATKMTTIPVTRPVQHDLASHLSWDLLVDRSRLLANHLVQVSIRNAVSRSQAPSCQDAAEGPARLRPLPPLWHLHQVPSKLDSRDKARQPAVHATFAESNAHCHHPNHR